MILTGSISELGLQKKVVARCDSRAIGSGQSFTDTSFKIMPPLIRRVDAAKTRTESQFNEGWGAVFLPGRAVNKVGNG